MQIVQILNEATGRLKLAMHVFSFILIALQA